MQCYRGKRTYHPFYFVAAPRSARPIPRIQYPAVRHQATQPGYLRQMFVFCSRRNFAFDHSPYDSSSGLELRIRKFIRHNLDDGTQQPEAPLKIWSELTSQQTHPADQMSLGRLGRLPLTTSGGAQRSDQAGPVRVN